MFWMRNKENNFPISTLIWRPDLLSFSLCNCKITSGTEPRNLAIEHFIKRKLVDSNFDRGWDAHLGTVIMSLSIAQTKMRLYLGNSFQSL